MDGSAGAGEIPRPQKGLTEMQDERTKKDRDEEARERAMRDESERQRKWTDLARRIG